jgi:hypothetical protein
MEAQVRRRWTATTRAPPQAAPPRARARRQRLKRLSKFNELIAGVRKAVPDLIIQVGGSISFAPD